jgi:phosphatidylglycerol:prolipoprotein diacylglycerol transferase
LLLNGAERFIIEQIRINNKFMFLGLNVTQAEIIASCLIILGTLGLIIFSKNRDAVNK